MLSSHSRVASAEARPVAVTRCVHAVAVSTATCHLPLLSVLAERATNNVPAVTATSPPTALPIIPTTATPVRKKLTNTQHRASIGNIVNEVSIPAVRGIDSFDAFVCNNSGVIGAVLGDYQRQYRYARETSDLSIT